MIRHRAVLCLGCFLVWGMQLVDHRSLTAGVSPFPHLEVSASPALGGHPCMAHMMGSSCTTEATLCARTRSHGFLAESSNDYPTPLGEAPLGYFGLDLWLLHLGWAAHLLAEFDDDWQPVIPVEDRQLLIPVNKLYGGVHFAMFEIKPEPVAPPPDPCTSYRLQLG